MDSNSQSRTNKILSLIFLMSIKLI